jgi:hypothetical protein
MHRAGRPPPSRRWRRASRATPRVASSRFCGPSAAARWPGAWRRPAPPAWPAPAPLQEPGGLLSVSVPWVTTMPCTSGRARWRHRAAPAAARWRIHVLAVELGHLLGSSRGTCQRRHGGQQVAHAALRGGVADVVGAAACRRWCRRCPGSRLRNVSCMSFALIWMKIQSLDRNAGNSSWSVHDSPEPARSSPPASSRFWTWCKAPSSAPAPRPRAPKSPPSWAFARPTPPRNTCRPWPARA